MVLTRECGEDVCIGEDIVIRVVRIGDGKVRLGITAPKEIPVHRREIKERIDAERKVQS